uniref:MFS domain-containing protein n=1 Tax=Panagrellus redivivus TaxID=6233 RepID=A0A7E4VTN9_PANRE
MSITPTYGITILCTALGASFQFYTYGVINPAQEVISAWINETNFERHGRYLDETSSNLFWSVVVAIVTVGGIFGALITK